MPNKDDYLLLSQLAQAGYCLRRVSLIMNEQLWQESADTAKGRFEHERVHDLRTEKRTDKISLYEQDVYSDSLQIIGKCDLIEAYRDEKGIVLPFAPFPVTLYPVEFKHGIVREEEYRIQLCAQAIKAPMITFTGVFGREAELPLYKTENLCSSIAGKTISAKSLHHEF